MLIETIQIPFYHTKLTISYSFFDEDANAPTIFINTDYCDKQIQLVELFTDKEFFTVTSPQFLKELESQTVLEDILIQPFVTELHYISMSNESSIKTYSHIHTHYHITKRLNDWILAIKECKKETTFYHLKDWDDVLNKIEENIPTKKVS